MGEDDVELRMFVRDLRGGVEWAVRNTNLERRVMVWVG